MRCRSAESGKRRASPSLTPKSEWRAIERWVTRVDADLASPRRAPDHGRRADLRLHRRSGRRRMEYRGARAEQEDGWRPISFIGCGSATAPGAWCISARESGIRASNCRAGRSTVTGARTANRSGSDEELIADESKPGTANEQSRGGFSARRRRSASVSTGSYVFPAYEDVFYYLWRERRLPANVDPFDSRLDDELERKRLARLFSQGLKADRRLRSAGGARDDDGAWRTGSWFLRDERCYLIPGRFADGLSAAARFAAVGRRGRLPVCFSAGSVGDSAALAESCAASLAVRARYVPARAADAKAVQAAHKNVAWSAARQT